MVELFRRPAGGMVESEKSTVLFSYFAQWFTDGFLRTDYVEPLKNTSNHDIDLSNLYGLTAEYTKILRSRVDGKLKSQIINGEEYPPFYYRDGQPDPEFVPLSMTHLLPRFEADARQEAGGRGPVRRGRGSGQLASRLPGDERPVLPRAQPDL